MDNSIIDKIRSGNSSVLVTVYEKYRNEFIVWAQRNYYVSEEEAKDVFQDVVIAFHNNCISGNLIQLSSDLKTYLFGIGKFKLINYKKRASRSVTFSLGGLINVIEPSENRMEKKHNDDHVKQVLERFFDDQCVDCREVLKKFYFDGKDMKTIASEMGYKNADVAKKKKYECFKKLADLIKKNSSLLVL